MEVITVQVRELVRLVAKVICSEYGLQNGINIMDRSAHVVVPACQALSDSGPAVWS